MPRPVPVPTIKESFALTQFTEERQRRLSNVFAQYGEGVLEPFEAWLLSLENPLNPRWQRLKPSRGT
jgi:hypothetical protein